MADLTSGQSLKNKFTLSIKQRILSGELAIGQRLPPEREIALKAGISRTIVHTGIADLVAKNVLMVIPRKGTFVNDFRKEATLELYNAILKYTGRLDENITKSLTVYREIIETANAGLAAQNRSPSDLESLRETLKKERVASSLDEKVALDYQFHLQIAQATGNIVLPMAVRSTEAMYKSLLRLFYEKLQDPGPVFMLQEKTISAIERRESHEAQAYMKQMLDFGAKVLMEQT